MLATAYHSQSFMLIWFTCLSLLIQPVPRLREMAAAALTNMMSKLGDAELVLRALPNLLEMLEQLIQPASEEAGTINVRSLSTLYSCPKLAYGLSY